LPYENSLSFLRREKGEVSLRAHQLVEFDLRLMLIKNKRGGAKLHPHEVTQLFIASAGWWWSAFENIID
jgi:hypothetical protein